MDTLIAVGAGAARAYSLPGVLRPHHHVYFESAADVGFAIGGGADIAVESADITLVGGDIGRVAAGIELSRRTMSIIRQNLFWALGYNVVAIPVAAAGRLNPMIAAAAMGMSSVSVVTNSLRLQRRGS